MIWGRKVIHKTSLGHMIKVGKPMRMLHCYDSSLHVPQMITSLVFQGLTQWEHNIVMTSESAYALRWHHHYIISDFIGNKYSLYVQDTSVEFLMSDLRSKQLVIFFFKSEKISSVVIW